MPARAGLRPFACLGAPALTPKFARSKTWYGRRFRLCRNTISWGRFSVEDSHYSELSDAAKNLARRRFREVNSQIIADAFEHLLCLQKPDALSSFYAEMEVLALYTFSKESLASAPGHSKRRDKILKAMSEALNAALTAVVQSARAIRGRDLEFISLTPTLASPYTAVFRNEAGLFDAVFDSELVLKSVHMRSEERKVWPPLEISSQQSALLANLI